MRFPNELAAILLLAACAGAPAGARSPALAAPASLAGVWTLTAGAAPACRIRLTAEPAAHGYLAVTLGGCRARISAWRPIPEGVELAAADGLTLVLLSPTGPNRYAGRDAAGEAAQLSR